MEYESEPGKPCPYVSRTVCQPDCWLWDAVDAPGKCSAREALGVGSEHPREFYNRMVMEAAR